MHFIGKECENDKLSAQWIDEMKFGLTYSVMNVWPKIIYFVVFLLVMSQRIMSFFQRQPTSQLIWIMVEQFKDFERF